MATHQEWKPPQNTTSDSQLIESADQTSQEPNSQTACQDPVEKGDIATVDSQPTGLAELTNENPSQPATLENDSSRSHNEHRVPSQEEMIGSCFITKEAFGDTIPPEIQRIIDEDEKMKETYKNIKEVNILIFGLVGSGKSALSNALRGLKPDEDKAAKEGLFNSEGFTTSVEGFSTVLTECIGMRIWDTPGMKDKQKKEKKHLDEICTVWERCVQRDLVIFCIRAEPRFVLGKNNPNVQAMIELTKKLGKSFWTNSVIVITFANLIQENNPTWNHLSPEERSKRFCEVIQMYKKEIANNMISYVKIDEEIANNIRIFPAGHQTLSESLPDRKYWLTPLWFGCIHTISSVEAKTALAYHSRHRFGHDIHLTDEFVPKELLEFEQKYKRNGGLIGLLGVLGGPTVVVTVLLGCLFGKKYGTKKFDAELKKRTSKK